MTARQISKKLVAARIDTTHLLIARDKVVIYVPAEDGVIDQAKTEVLVGKVRKALKFGGHCRASGAWVLEKEHVSMGDASDKANRWHF